MGLFGLFRKNRGRNATVPANETEQWLTAVYAMWSEWTEGDWHYFAGAREKSKEEGASMRLMLRRDWNIHNKAELLKMVEDLKLLLVLGAEEGGEGIPGWKEGVAWDLCRACQILSMGYVGGYIDREEMICRSVEIGCRIQQQYYSWEDLYERYLLGYAEWRYEQGGDAEEDIAQRREICFGLLRNPEGPCRIRWDLKLKGSP